VNARLSQYDGLPKRTADSASLSPVTSDRLWECLNSTHSFRCAAGQASREPCDRTSPETRRASGSSRPPPLGRVHLDQSRWCRYTYREQSERGLGRHEIHIGNFDDFEIRDGIQQFGLVVGNARSEPACSVLKPRWP